MRIGTGIVLLLLIAMPALAQDKKKKSGINAAFQNPNVKEFRDRFERDGREVYDHRDRIIAECGLKPGNAIADVGAGTGFMSLMFAKAVGPSGKVLAVDVADNFLKHIDATAKGRGIQNIQTIKATQETSNLPSDSVDIVFICDTYHHFEFPQKTLKTIYQAMHSGGSLLLIDFERIPGVTREWTLQHVRAGKEVFREEIEQAGFVFVEEKQGIMKENYFLRFEKPKGT